MSAEDKATFIYIIQQWVQETGIELGFYWNRIIPDAATPCEAICRVKYNSFIPKTVKDIERGWFSFIMEDYKNRKDEPFIFSLNSDCISKVCFSKDRKKPYLKIYSKPRPWWKSIFSTPLVILIKREQITISSGKKIEAEYFKKE